MPSPPAGNKGMAGKHEPALSCTAKRHYVLLVLPRCQSICLSSCSAIFLVLSARFLTSTPMAPVFRAAFQSNPRIADITRKSRDNPATETAAQLDILPRIPEETLLVCILGTLNKCLAHFSLQCRIQEPESDEYDKYDDELDN